MVNGIVVTSPGSREFTELAELRVESWTVQGIPLNNNVSIPSYITGWLESEWLASQ